MLWSTGRVGQLNEKVTVDVETGAFSAIFEDEYVVLGMWGFGKSELS